MNKEIYKFYVLFMVAFLTSFYTSATTYYISPSGNDWFNNGTSPSTAWATPNRLDYYVDLNPGDAVLFEGGKVFSGRLYLNAEDAGTATAPVTIGSYGTGKATIYADTVSGIFLENTAGIRIKDLIFKGEGVNNNGGSGIFFWSNLMTNLDYIYIDNVEVTNFRKQGIIIGYESIGGGYSNITIVNSKVYNCDLNGIQTYGPGSDKNIKNIVVRNTKAFDNSGILGYTAGHTGSGIMLSAVDGGLIEYCEAYNNGTLNSWNVGGPVGIWGYKCNNLIIQYNEAHHNRTGSTKDGGGFDLDGGCTNSIMQYNYSHDNDGAGYLLAQYSGAPTFKDNIVRYNISENDGRKNNYSGIALWATNSNGGIQNSQIYNNTVYITPSGAGNPKGIYVMSGSISNANFRNNIVQVTGGIEAVNSYTTSGVRFENNAYWSTGAALKFVWGSPTYTTIGDWQTATTQETIGGSPVGIVADPGLTTPGQGGTIGQGLPNKLNTLTAYKLTDTSPVRTNGSNLSTYNINNGGKDFWGSSVVNLSTYSIGAYQVPPAKTTPTITFNALPNKTTLDAAFALTATSTNTTSTTPITYTSNNASVITVSNVSGTWKATVVGAGSAIITASQIEDVNYNAASASQTQTVVKVTPVITFKYLPSKNIGDPAYTLSATSTNTGTLIVFTSDKTSVISISNNNTANVVGLGYANITATQASNATYNAASATQPQYVAPVGIVRIEGEAWASQGGVYTETCKDTGGGKNVAGMGANDWTKYNVSVSSAGTYTMNFRVASTSAGQFEVRNSTGTVLATISVPNTAGWQAWTTITVQVPLIAGTQIIQVYSLTGGFNLNWLEVESPAVTTQPTATKSTFTESFVSASSIDALVIYPNPTSDHVQVKLGSQMKGNVTIDLVNADGTVIKHIKLYKSRDEVKQSVSLKAFSKGIYFIHIKANGINEVKKIIKN